MEYIEKTDSMRHQADIFKVTKDIPAYGLFWEQGVGKTKPSIDKFSYLYEKGEVEALVVYAPKGVERNWMNDELLKHMPDRLLSKASMYLYNADGAKAKKRIRARKELLKYKGGPRILCISYSALLTDSGKAYVRKFCLTYRCMIVADESQMFKSPSTKTAITVVTSGRYAKYKTILSGTPITQGAFDVYSQMMFLDEDFWKNRQLHPFEVFKNHFGVFIKKEDYNRESEQFKAETGFERPERKYDVLVDYKNKDELKGYLKLMTHRLTKDTAGIKLPPKVYTKRYFDLTPAQMAVYQELEMEYLAELPESGDWIEAPDVLTRLTRLQQIVSGYVACTAEDPVQPIDGKFPRLDLLAETLSNTEGKTIIWSRFTPDIDLIMARLTKMGRNPVRYDGQVTENQKERNKIAFQNDPEVTDFVGKPQSGATGLTLHAAKSVHYYTNSYNAAHRWQSEDRAHRIGLKHSVLYVDYIANYTKDNDILTNLRKKSVFAADMLGDAQKETF